VTERRKYRKFTPDQKLEIVFEVLRGGRGVTEVCREHHIDRALFYSWRDQVLHGAKARLAGKQSSADVGEVSKRIADLERTLGQKAMELEIAKKALRDWE
jgi:transposase